MKLQGKGDKEQRKPVTLYIIGCISSSSWNFPWHIEKQSLTQFIHFKHSAKIPPDFDNEHDTLWLQNFLENLHKRFWIFWIGHWNHEKIHFPLADTGSFQKSVELISVDSQDLEVEQLVQSSGNLTKAKCWKTSWLRGNIWFEKAAAKLFPMSGSHGWFFFFKSHMLFFQ